MSLQNEINLQTVPERSKSKKMNMSKLLPYLFIAPTTIIIIAFLFYPIGTVFYYSLQNYDLSTPYYNGFIGFDNFIKIFTEDKLFFPICQSKNQYLIN